MAAAADPYIKTARFGVELKIPRLSAYGSVIRKQVYHALAQALLTI
jgi:hypothetical protein